MLYYYQEKYTIMTIIDKNRIIMIMVDGFGIPSEGWQKSVYSKYCSKEFLKLLSSYSTPLDTTMTIPGIPQSATGQTALFTGINAAQVMKRHYPAFPGPTLKKIITEQNIFKTLIQHEKSVSFANAYIRYSLSDLLRTRFSSVTTTMSGTVFKDSLNTSNLLSNSAVYHDITRETVNKKYEVPVITPEDAANDLINISSKSDFTLFEFFLTDIAGHKQNLDFLAKVLKILSRFILQLTSQLPSDTILLICSDHGNCEDVKISTHTYNKVPLILFSKKYLITPRAKSIVDVYNLIVELLINPSNSTYHNTNN